MNPPVRAVCGGCLRSVEIVLGEDQGNGDGAAEVNRCPHCGSVIDSQVDPSEFRTKLAATRQQGTCSHLGADESEEDWVETWSRGSLGSLGRFQLRERLGDGGFGQVFLAYDPRLDRDIALKVLKERNPSERVMERFFREARSAARLDHPNIVAVYDAGFDQGRCWVAFHFVSGRPLTWHRDHHRLDPPTSARILRDLADAVDHAHRQGVLHRDIKPANVLIDDHGRPRLIDFGLARRSDLDSSLTRDGAVVGTPAYMSPEQALGFSKQVDERSDVFSLGVIFFEVLSGQRPYPTLSYPGTSDGGELPPSPPGKKPAPSARSINPDVPSALDRICLRAIAQNPADRYPSARALADDLDLWLLAHRGGKVRLSRAATTMVLVLAGVVLLAVGLREALVPWRNALSPQESRGAEVVQAVPPEQEETVSPLTLATGPDRPVQMIGNSRTGLYHTSHCPDVARIADHNRVVLKDVAEAVAQGLRPCSHCHPAESAPGRNEAGGE